MNRLLTDNTLSVEQAEKMRAMIIIYQRKHPKDQLTTDWKAMGIDAEDILVENKLLAEEELSDVSDLSE